MSSNGSHFGHKFCIVQKGQDIYYVQVYCVYYVNVYFVFLMLINLIFLSKSLYIC